jgi:hypothetical protein
MPRSSGRTPEYGRAIDESTGISPLLRIFSRTSIRHRLPNSKSSHELAKPCDSPHSTPTLEFVWNGSLPGSHESDASAASDAANHSSRALNAWMRYTQGTWFGAGLRTTAGTSCRSPNPRRTSVVTTHVSAWFGRDARPPTSGVSPIRPDDRTDVRGWRAFGPVRTTV